jgi:hypothetical protein
MSSPTPLWFPSIQTELEEIPPTQLQVSGGALETRALRDRNAIRTLLLQQLISTPMVQCPMDKRLGFLQEERPQDLLRELRQFFVT